MKAIIIDDERNCREVISALASNYTPQLDIIAEFDNGIDAIKEINNLKPDVLFLDIEMPLMNGFEFLEKCTYKDYYIVFTTAYNEYAIKAIKHHAFDYLLKPIHRKEFINTVERILRENLKTQNFQVQELLDHLKEKKESKRIVLSTLEGIHFLEPADICFVKGEGAYSNYHCVDGNKILVSKTLKDAESILPALNFIRVHASYIINLDYIKTYQKGEGGFIILKDGVSIPVSRTKKKEILDLLAKGLF